MFIEHHLWNQHGAHHCLRHVSPSIRDGSQLLTLRLDTCCIQLSGWCCCCCCCWSFCCCLFCSSSFSTLRQGATTMAMLQRKSGARYWDSPERLTTHDAWSLLTINLIFWLPEYIALTCFASTYGCVDYGSNKNPADTTRTLDPDYLGACFFPSFSCIVQRAELMMQPKSKLKRGGSMQSIETIGSSFGVPVAWLHIWQKHQPKQSKTVDER